MNLNTKNLSCYLDVDDFQPALTGGVSVDALVEQVLSEISKVVLPIKCEGLPTTFSARFADDAEVQELNAQFRGKNKPTNVLSFEGDEDIPGVEKEEQYIGDIIISCDTLAKEASEQGKTVNDHLKHLMVHGVLHLYGFDHIEDDEADVMERLETQILNTLGVADPYLLEE